MASHTYEVALRDYSLEVGRTRVHMGPITAGTIAGALTQMGALRTAIAAITKGVVASEQWVGDNTNLSNAAPTDEEAQRETKWLVLYQGDTSLKKFQITIPTADFQGRLLPESDKADLTETSMAAFVTAFEAIARTPDSDTETVTVLEIRVAGK